jgi:predicted secreted Zn-dependent protease
MKHKLAFSSLISAFIVSCLSLTTALPTSAPPTELSGATIEYYTVGGTTADEIRDNLNAVRARYTGANYDAYTSWRVSWNWTGYGTRNCDLNSVRVLYTAHVVLPRWQQPVNADPALIIKWNNYLSALIQHEQGHVNFAAQNLEKYKTAIQSATCLTAEQAAQNFHQTIVQAEKEYDRQTNHGIDTGAVFP